MAAMTYKNKNVFLVIRYAVCYCILFQMNAYIVPNKHRYCLKWTQILFQMNTDIVPNEHRYCSKWKHIVPNEHRYCSKWTQILF